MKQEKYEGTFANVHYDGGDVLRVVSKDGSFVHPVFLESDGDRKFYSEFLKMGVQSGDITNYVDSIVDEQESEHPSKIANLKLRLGIKAFVRDWTQGDRAHTWRPN
ncbi:MAG: hypothetical protein ABIB47_05465 [Candidatus Woesearchaeota archaeon]